MARRSYPAILALVAAGVLMAGCPGSPTNPSSATPRITGVSPASGTTFGGTVVSIIGSNLGVNTRVTFGGTAATDLTVVDTSTVTVKTPIHATGTVDVAASNGGAAGTLRSAFQFVAPSVSNTPPTVTLIAKGTRTNEPSGYANIDESLQLQATVVDAESSASAFTFDWSAEAGVVSGTGAATTFQAPHTAARPSIRVTVTENYSTPDANGLPIANRHVVSASTFVDVHDELAEIGTMARTFLVKFSQSNVSPTDVMVDFKDGCGLGGTGKIDEYNQTVNNRLNYRIVDYTVGQPRVTVGFKGVSPFRARKGDAYAAVDVRWLSQCLVSGAGCTTVGGTREDSGVDWLTSEYDSATRRWWLCDSDFQGTAGTTLTMRYLK